MRRMVEAAVAMRQAVVVVLGVVMAGGAVMGCSIPPNQSIWTKHLDSDTPLFRVVLGGKAGYIDRDGRVVIGPAFSPDTFVDSSGGDFVQGAAEVMGDANGRIAGWLLYPDGRRVARDGPRDRFSEGLSTFMQKPAVDQTRPPKLVGLLGYEDQQGAKMIQARFAFGGDFAEGLAPVALDGACWVLSPLGWRWPAPSAEQVFTSCGPQPARTVTQPCRHGYVDKSGAFVIGADSELARSFREGRGAVRKSERWGFFGARGQGCGAAAV